MTSNGEREFAEKFRRCRLLAWFESQAALASLAEVNRSAVSRAENGHVPGPVAFEKMLAALRRSNSKAASDFDDLEQLWKRTRDTSAIPVQPTAFDQFLQDLSAAYQDAPEQEVFQEELEMVADLWKRYAVAQDLHEKGRHDLAKREYEYLLDALEISEGQHRLKARALYGLGRAERYFSKWDTALENLVAAEKLAKKSMDPDFQIKVLWTIGDVHRRRYHLDQALASYEKAEGIFVPLSTSHEDYRRSAVTKRKIASIYLFQGNGKDALNYCKDSHQIAMTADSSEDIIKAKQHMAWSLSLMGEWNEARDLHHQAINERERAQVEGWKLAKTRRYYAEILRVIGMLVESERQYLNALADLKRHGIAQEEVMIRGPILLGLGQIARKNGNLLQAKKYLRESQTVNAKDSFFYAQSQSELAKLAAQEDRFDDAEELFEEALKTYKTTNNEYFTVAMKLNLAELAFQRGDPARALAELEILLKEVDNNAGLIIHEIRAIKLKARAMLASDQDVASVAKFYCSAFSSAAINLENQYLCDEVLLSLLEDLKRLKEEQRDKELVELCADAKNLCEVPTNNPAITLLVDSWYQKVEELLLVLPTSPAKSRQ